MSTINSNVAIGYVTNSTDRLLTVARWQILFEAMPIGVPMTAAEIAEKANENPNRLSWFAYSYHNVPPMARAMSHAIKREKVAIEPYEVAVKDFWNGNVIKTITVTERTVYTRML